MTSARRKASRPHNRSSVRSSVRSRPLNGQSIVITGATSGVGLSTARRAARAGAAVFLIARSEAALKALCESLQAEGARAAWAVADVADFDALAAAAEKCRRLFGGFDAWINNAGVSIYGPIEQTTLEDQRRLFETNYWGVVNGSLIAVEHLKQREGGGTIVNVGSILSDAPLPVQGVYSASKHAVKGFTNALRMELIQERAPVRLSLVKPAAIATPYGRHARNLTGYAVAHPQPVYAAHVAADVILHCVRHPVREITVGGAGRLAATFYALAPAMAEPLFAKFAPSMMRDRHSAFTPYEDGLYDPTEDGLDEEVHYPMVRQSSLLAEVRKHPGIAGGVVAVLAGIGLATVLLNQRSGPTRYEALKSRIDGWSLPDLEALRHRVDDIARSLRGRGHDLADEAGERVADFADEARGRSRRWYEKARKPARRYQEQARRYASDAGDFARDHAREGGALLAFALTAAAVAAAVMDARSDDSRIRKLIDR
jgi:short-subunit dehydrogenase